jgi:hypothetical protein
MEVFLAYPEKQEQLEALKAFLTTQKIKFERKQASPYNEAFVAKIKKAEANVEKGEYITIENPDNIWNSILSE